MKIFWHVDGESREPNLTAARNLYFGAVRGVVMEVDATLPFCPASWLLCPSPLRARALLWWISVPPYSHDHPARFDCLFVPYCCHLSWIAVQAQPECVVERAKEEVAKIEDAMFYQR